MKNSPFRHSISLLVAAALTIAVVGSVAKADNASHDPGYGFSVKKVAA